MRILNSISSQKKKVSRDVFYNISDREQAFLCLYETQAGFCNTDFFISINGRGKDRCETVISHHMKKVIGQQLKFSGFQEMAHLDSALPAVHHTFCTF